ncbi:MAG: TRAP transporter substrate-binding protein [Proteobacteria bacterium]|nr:TRAP transporter substrate-binding protein [Pseudomonadota bacterium]
MNSATRIAGAALVTFGIAIGTAQAQMVATLAGSDALGSLYDRQNRMFTDLVNKRAKGALTINFIAGEQLGTDIQVIEQAMTNAVQFYGDDLSWYANWVKDYSILSWGFTFRNPDHMQRFFDSGIYKAIAKRLQDGQGLRILAQAPIQPRIMFSNKPIKSGAGIEGLKMRVPEIKTYLELWQTLGARPTRVAWGEVFLALKTGVVEAAEGPVSAAYAAKFYEAAPNVIRTDHVLAATHFMVNEKFYQSLSPDLQKIVTDTAAEVAQWARKQAAAETEGLYGKMAAAGAKVSKIDVEPLRKKSVAAVKRMEEAGAWSKGLWQTVQDIPN